jgi:hypothetical protein
MSDHGSYSDSRGFCSQGTGFRGAEKLIARILAQAGIGKQRQKRRPLPQVRESVPVFEALVDKLKGTAAVAEVEMGLGDVG